jgi:RNA polymerase sigma factor (sigma-70 family)
LKQAQVLVGEESLIEPGAGIPAVNFARLYDQLFPPIYNYVRYRCGDGDLADDLTAQVFERALTRLDSYSAERGPFRTWLFTIAHNVVNNHWRWQALRRWLPWEALQEQASPEPPPEEQTVQRETGRALDMALKHLSERERSLLALKFTGRMTNIQIAQITGLSASHVGTLLFRAIHRLQAEMSPLEERDE